MKRRNFLICTILAISLLLTACIQPADDFKAPAQFYYCTEEISYHSSKGVIRAEARETSMINADLHQLLNAYLAGPASSELVSPFPAGSQVVDIAYQDDAISIILSEAYTNLTGIDLTLANACLAMTVCEYTGVSTVSLAIEGTTIGGKEKITLSKDGYLFIDHTAAEQNEN